MRVRASRHRPWRTALWVYTGLVMAFLVLPLAVIVPLSFTGSDLLLFPPPSWSLRWYVEFLTGDLWLRALKNSLIVGSLTAILATVLGTMAAFGLVRDDVRGKAAIMAVLISPMVVPSVITAVSLFFLFSWLGMVGTYAALVIGHTAIALPFVVITVGSVLQTFDRAQVKAGASLGGSPLYVLRRVTLPQIAPGVLAGAMFAFATSFDEVVLALFIGSPEERTLPRQILSGVKETVSPTIAAVATILIVTSVAGLSIVEILRARKSRHAPT